MTMKVACAMTVMAVIGIGGLAGAGSTLAMGGWGESEEADNCGNADGAFDEAAFVVATEPKAGARVTSGFEVRGCSRSFESNVQWRLVGRNGSVLGSGHTRGGGVDGPGAFSFTVPYTASEAQIGHLEVFDEDPSDGEGFPPGRTILPLVLNP